jgi:hypothetical protein
MVAAYVAVVAGVPLPAGKTQRKSGELFPCASSGCGCDSADSCWSGCCCHTLPQRLAWAKENNVRPPEFALVEARNAGFDTSRWDGSPKLVTASVAAKSCCSTKKTAAVDPSCCSQKGVAAHTCCSSKGDSESNDDDHSIIGWRALACHGQSLNWLAAVPTLIAVELELADEFPLVAWLGPHSSDSAAGVSDAPTPPPPERA